MKSQKACLMLPSKWSGMHDTVRTIAIIIRNEKWWQHETQKGEWYKRANLCIYRYMLLWMPFTTLKMSVVGCSRYNQSIAFARITFQKSSQKLAVWNFHGSNFCNLWCMLNILTHTTCPISWFIISQVQTNLQNTWNITKILMCSGSFFNIQN